MLSFAQVKGVGDIAQQLNEGPMYGITQVMYGVSYTLAFLLLYLAYQGYDSHKSNPYCGLGTPVVMTILGIGLLILPSAHLLIRLVT